MNPRNASKARAGFYNELMALGDVVAEVQGKVEGMRLVWEDPEIQTALSVCDPDDVHYNVDAAEDTYTRTYDRMLVMLKNALRRSVAQAGMANAEDARDWERSHVQ